MITKVFLVLILSLGGPYSSFTSVGQKNPNHCILVVEDRSQTLYFQDSVGIVPIITDCKVVRKAEQSTPTFAGVITNFFHPIGKDLAGYMQKYKLRGLMKPRNVIKPLTQTLAIPQITEII